MSINYTNGKNLAEYYDERQQRYIPIKLEKIVAKKMTASAAMKEASKFNKKKNYDAVVIEPQQGERFYKIGIFKQVPLEIKQPIIRNAASGIHALIGGRKKAKILLTTDGSTKVDDIPQLVELSHLGLTRIEAQSIIDNKITPDVAKEISASIERRLQQQIAKHEDNPKFGPLLTLFNLFNAIGQGERAFTVDELKARQANFIGQYTIDAKGWLVDAYTGLGIMCMGKPKREGNVFKVGNLVVGKFYTIVAQAKDKYDFYMTRPDMSRGKLIKVVKPEGFFAACLRVLTTDGETIDNTGKEIIAHDKQYAKAKVSLVRYLLHNFEKIPGKILETIDKKVIKLFLIKYVQRCNEKENKKYQAEHDGVNADYYLENKAQFEELLAKELQIPGVACATEKMWPYLSNQEIDKVRNKPISAKIDAAHRMGISLTMKATNEAAIQIAEYYVFKGLKAGTAYGLKQSDKVFAAAKKAADKIPDAAINIPVPKYGLPAFCSEKLVTAPAPAISVSTEGIKNVIKHMPTGVGAKTADEIGMATAGLGVTALKMEGNGTSNSSYQSEKGISTNKSRPYDEKYNIRDKNNKITPDNREPHREIRKK
ncbi:MAG: hypothetical protein JW841_09190 [Deltaproteobacteria bacterium]|nr:hypothetical protein [Deltaproteobacteria bacterium]